MMSTENTADPMGLRAQGCRFVIRKGDAMWRKSWDKEAGDLDVTDLPTEHVGEIFARERAKYFASTTTPKHH